MYVILQRTMTKYLICIKINFTEALCIKSQIVKVYLFLGFLAGLLLLGLLVLQDALNNLLFLNQECSDNSVLDTVGTS